MLARRLAESLPERYPADSVELTQLNIGYSVVSKSSGPSGQPYIPPNVPAGAAATGLLLGYGIVAAVQRAVADESAFVSISVRIGDTELTTIRSVSINRDRAAHVAVEEALGSALDDIAAQARAPEAPGSKEAVH